MQEDLRPVRAAAAVAALPVAAAAQPTAAIAVAAALAAALDHLLGDHLLRRVVPRRRLLEPQLLRWHHPQRRRAIHLERAIGGGARRNVHPGYE